MRPTSAIRTVCLAFGTLCISFVLIDAFVLHRGTTDPWQKASDYGWESQPSAQYGVLPSMGLFQSGQQPILNLNEEIPNARAAGLSQADSELQHFMSSQKPKDDKIVVAGRMSYEDTAWISEELPEWQNAVYTVDDHDPALHTPMNKGREAMAYLTYIIDNYDHLPATIAFVHSHKDGYPEAWHTDDDQLSNVNVLRALNTQYVQDQGFTNLRCNDEVGCPQEITLDPDKGPDVAYPAAVAFWHEWQTLFPDRPRPPVIAAACCAQFAVSRTQVRSRPHEDYVRYREWVANTTLTDHTSGRVMEYSWHMIFGKEPVHCPDVVECYCKLYGRYCDGHIPSGNFNFRPKEQG